MSEQAALQERIAQLSAHRACTNEEHDPLHGKLSGYCVVCGIPWPCEVAKPSPLQQEADKDGELTKIGFLLRPRSGDIHFIQRIETLPLAVHETMEVFAALPQKDSKI